MANTFFTRLSSTVKRTFYYAPSNFVGVNHNDRLWVHTRFSNLGDNFRRHYGLNKPNPMESSSSSNSEREVDTDQESLRTGRFTNAPSSPKPVRQKKQNPLRFLNPFKPLMAISDTVKYSLGRGVDFVASKDQNLSSPVSRVLKGAIQTVFMPLEISLSAANFVTDETLNLTYKAGIGIKKGVKKLFSSPPLFKRNSYKVASMKMPKAEEKPVTTQGKNLEQAHAQGDAFVLNALLRKKEHRQKIDVPAPKASEQPQHTARPVA